jgi:hypothetical protein
MKCSANINRSISCPLAEARNGQSQGQGHNSFQYAIPHTAVTEV